MVKILRQNSIAKTGIFRSRTFFDKEFSEKTLRYPYKEFDEHFKIV